MAPDDGIDIPLQSPWEALQGKYAAQGLRIQAIGIDDADVLNQHTDAIERFVDVIGVNTLTVYNSVTILNIRAGNRGGDPITGEIDYFLQDTLSDNVRGTCDELHITRPRGYEEAERTTVGEAPAGPEPFVRTDWTEVDADAAKAKAGRRRTRNIFIGTTAALTAAMAAGGLMMLNQKTGPRKPKTTELQANCGVSFQDDTPECKNKKNCYTVGCDVTDQHDVKPRFGPVGPRKPGSDTRDAFIAFTTNRTNRGVFDCMASPVRVKLRQSQKLPPVKFACTRRHSK